MSGSSGGGGYEYQARATAYVAAHILAQHRLSWIEHENADVPIAVAEETGGAGDDLCITLQDDIRIELQAKHGLQKDKLWEPLIKLGQGLQENRQLYGVLLTDSTASKIIREDLRNDFKRLGQGRTDGLKAITQEVQQKLVEANLPEADPDFFRRLVIVVLDLDDGLQDGKHAQLLLRNVLHDPKQSASSWKVLWGEGLKLISNRGCRDSKAWARLLSNQGIQLASACARANGMRSPEETEYLETVKEKFQLWWKRDAFMAEINESTWREFGLKVKTPMPTLIACAKAACDEFQKKKSNVQEIEFVNVQEIEFVADKCGYRTKPTEFKKELIKECSFIGVTISGFEDFKKKIPNIPEEIILPILDSLMSVLYKAKEQFLIVGRPGAGKSTFLAQTLLIAATKALQDSEAPIPALIKLKSYANQPNVVQLIKAAFEKQNFLLGMLEHEKLSYIENLIKKERLLLLVDGINESEKEAHIALKDFCDRNLPMILATRDIGTGNLRNQKKLEIQPLKTEEVKEFLSNLLPHHQNRVRELCDRVQDFGQTPLIAWMTYSIFKKTGEIPETRGVVYREFAGIYAREKGLDVYETRSQLGKLAFEMICSEEPLYESQIQNLLGTTPHQDLLNHHLLQPDGGMLGSRQLEFCHQTLQEYFAAEYLLLQFGKHFDELTRKQPGQQYTHSQINYFNYRKWTEAIALMLGFPEIQDKAEKLVKLTLNVDLKLGARLAGEVKPDLQAKTISMIAEQKIPEWFRILLLGETKSPKAVDELVKILEHPDPAIRRRAAWASRQMSREIAMSVIDKAIKDSDPNVRETAIRVIAELDIEQAVSLVVQILPHESIASVRKTAVFFVLGNSESEIAILELLRLTQDNDYDVTRTAVHCLEKMNRKVVISVLTKALKNRNTATLIRKSAAELLGELGDESDLPHLFEAQLNLSEDVCFEAPYFFHKLRNRVATSERDTLERQKKQKQKQISMWREYLTCEEPARRANAVYHLATFLSKEEAIPLVKSALDDSHHDVRGHAISSLASLLGKEAFPQVVRALDDVHYRVRGKAAQALIDFRQDLPEKLEISEETVSNLIQVLNEDQDIHARSTTINTLTNLCSIQPSLLLRKDLENAILDASNASDSSLRWKAAIGLGQFSSEKSVSRLLQMMKDSDSHTVLTATNALKGMPDKITAKYLPDLIELILNSEEGFALDAIFSIQKRCGFYNYEIAQAVGEEGKKEKEKGKKEGVKTILILASSPGDKARLRLDKEVREIDEALRRSQQRDQFKLEQKWAVRADDLRRALLDVKPDIVHFCGHGIGSGGLLVEDEMGQAKPVSTEALANLFALFADQIECVVLNACYSEIQANAIVQHIPYVIGMQDAVGDTTAIKFAIGFYDGLAGRGADRKVYEDAYKFGCNAIQLENLPGHLTPSLLKKADLDKCSDPAQKSKDE